MQLGQLRSALSKFSEIKAQILAIDPHESWSAKYLLKEAGATTDELNFPLLMDPSLTVSATYGVAFQMRIHVERSNRPATFIIDTEGIVRFVQRAERFNDRPSPSKIIEVLNSLNENTEEKTNTNSDNLDALIQRSVTQLLEIQEDDGAWPYEGVYRVRGNIPVGYRVGGTSIVCTSLLYARDKCTTDQERIDKSIERAVEIILKDLDDERMQLDTSDRYDVRVWGHIYALDFFCRLRASEQFATLRKKTDPWIPKLVEILVAEQIEDGGWNYAGQRRHASFVTAPAVQALLLAREQGNSFDDNVLSKAKKVLEDSRTDEGAFAYSGTGARRTQLPGSIARSAICESTLRLLGGGDVDHVRDSIEAFHTHWDELEKRRKKTGTHKPPYGVAPYYFYFGHRYLAQAIKFLPEEEEQSAARERFVKVLMETQDADGTWNDRVFERSKAYGTAMSLLAILDNVPLPKVER